MADHAHCGATAGASERRVQGLKPTAIGASPPCDRSRRPRPLFRGAPRSLWVNQKSRTLGYTIKRRLGTVSAPGSRTIPSTKGQYLPERAPYSGGVLAMQFIPMPGVRHRKVPSTRTAAVPVGCRAAQGTFLVVHPHAGERLGQNITIQLPESKAMGYVSTTVHSVSTGCPKAQCVK